MRAFKNVNLAFILLAVLTNSCQSHSVVSTEYMQSTNSKLNEMTCEKLIEKSADASFSLKGLAGIRAHRNCKDFKYDFQQLSDLEKRLYAEELDELDSKKAAPTSSLSISEIRKNLAATKKPEEKSKLYKQLRSKQKNAGLRNDYLRTTADFFNWSKSNWKKNKKDAPSVLAFYEATLLLSRTYWTEHKVDQASKILDETLRLLKGSTSVAEIYYIKGRMAEEQVKFDDAIAQYDLVLEDMKATNPKNLSFTQDRLLWQKSWILYKNKNWETAGKSFQELATTTTDKTEKSRALFFFARCQNRLDKKTEAQKILEDLIKEDSFSFYGLVSHYELGIKLPPISQLKTEKKFPFDYDLNFLGETERKLFKDLIYYKEVDIAEKAVAIMAKGVDKQVNMGIYLADNGQRFLPLFASFPKLDNNDKMELIAKYGNLLFPQPHFERVKQMSEKTQLPTSLIYSIMKQESAFNEKTRSHADAMGLMQMIPKLAKQLSKKFEVSYSKPEDLYNPEINIQLGSYELMEQVRKQSGQLTFVAAAYNAGPNALANWLKTRKRADIVEFIEEIPYDETRTYVKIIARNKLFYDRISKRDEEQPFPIEFLTSPLIVAE